MIYSKYQEDFFNCLIATNSNICLKATAGSGKTTTAVQATKFLPYGKSSLFCAFNKHIVVELKEKLPTTVQCQTLHSIGLRALFNHYPPGSVKIKDNKQIQFIEHLFDKEKTRREKWTKVYETDKILRLVRATMTSLVKEEIEALTANHNLFPEAQIIEATIIAGNSLIEYNSDPEKYGLEIDFQDMVELCVKDKEIRLPKFDFVIIDEAQDCSRLDQLFVEKLIKPVTGRLIAIGDEHQCQPEGTKILMSDRSIKKIEDVRVGDRIARLNGSCYNYNGVIEKISSRQVNEKLIKITSNDVSTKYTYNHKCLIQIDRDKTGYVLYLMRKGDQFRIGMTTWYERVFLNGRHRAEKCDDIWLLKISEDKREILNDEQFYSYLYGIPQLSWIIGTGVKDKKSGQENLDTLNEKIAKECNTRERAEKLLSFFGRSINHSFWSKSKPKKFNLIETVASNLIPGYMKVNHYDTELSSFKRKCGKWLSIQKVEEVEYNGLVYSLKTSHKENYVADGILTHNSIYSFRGADINSFQNFQNRPNTITLPLSISYRLSKKLVANAKKIYPEIEPWEQAKEGVEVKKGKIEDMRTGDIVLSRNLRPLVEVFFSLIEQNKKCTIVGKELEEGLLALVENLNSETSVEEMNIGLDERLLRIENELSRKGITTPKNHPRYEAIEEKISVLKRVARHCGSVGEVREKLDSIFSDNSIGAIKLMTIHKSKGLENDRVFLVETFEKKKLIPNKYAVTKDQLVQEKNLQFVAETRAKSELIKIYL